MRAVGVTRTTKRYAPVTSLTHETKPRLININNNIHTIRVGRSYHAADARACKHIRCARCEPIVCPYEAGGFLAGITCVAYILIIIIINFAFKRFHRR